MSFSTLGLADALVRAVTEQGYTVPTPIQKQAIPAVLAGGDLLAGAQTGTGKTAGFVLPMLQRLSTRSAPGPAHAKKPIRALILTPTRELAAQVEESVRVYGKYLRISSMVIYGGVGINPQIAQLAPRRRRAGRDARPPARPPGTGHARPLQGRDPRARRGRPDARHGLHPRHQRILALLPKQRQNLLFSATFSDEIKNLADGLLNAPAMIEVAPRNSTVEIIAQRVHPVDRDRKRELLTHLIGSNNWHQVLVFTRTKHGANKLAEQLGKDGITALAIHGNKSQGARTRALAEFKDGSLQVLVATDIAARGIDIDQLPHVVNYDLPNVPEDYVHRIGRTGRAGASGEAISLVCVDEHEFLRDIEKLLKRTLPRDVIAGFEPDPQARAEPILQRQGRGGARTPPRGAAGGGAAAAPALPRRRRRMPRRTGVAPRRRRAARSCPPGARPPTRPRHRDPWPSRSHALPRQRHRPRARRSRRSTDRSIAGADAGAPSPGERAQEPRPALAAPARRCRRSRTSSR